jgi:hypothetical protein
MISKIEFEKVRDEIVATLLRDDSLTKIEKLATIESERLWGYADWIQRPFGIWEEEIQAMVTQPYGRSFVDDFFHYRDYERYIAVSFADAMEYLLEEEIDEEQEGKKDPLILVLSTRGNRAELKKPLSEVIDVLFDFACENKIVGFINDW